MYILSPRICIALIAAAIWIGTYETSNGQMAQSTADGNARKTVGFDQVKPILRKRCQNCHNPEELRGDLSLNDMTAINAGSSSGPVVVAGKPKESLLYTTTAHLDEPQMPPNSRKIPGRELDILKRWIEDGLVMKSGDLPAAAEPKRAVEPDKATKTVETMKEEHSSAPADNSSFVDVRPLLQKTAISALATQPHGTVVAMPGDQQIAFWDASTQQFKSAIDFPESEVTQLAFASNGETLVVAGGLAGLNSSVFGYDPQTGKELFRVADENDSILGLDLSPNGEFVALGGPSKLLKLCRVRDGEIVHTLRKHTDWVLVTKFSPDGLLVASADRFGGVFVWETQSGEVFHSLKGHNGPVHSLAWGADGETLISGGEDGQLRVWNMHHGELTAQWDAQVGAILSLERKAGFTVVGGRDGLVKAWRTPEESTGTYNVQEQAEAVAMLPETEQVVCTDSAGNIHLLQLPELQPVKSSSLPSTATAHPQLLARLEQQTSEYEAMQREEKAQQLLAQKQAMAQSSPAVTASNPSMAAAIQREIDATKSSLDQQLQMQESLERQLVILESQLQLQNGLVASTQKQLERLDALKRLTQGERTAGRLSPEEESAILSDQLDDQNNIQQALQTLQQRAKKSAQTATRLSVGSRPQWDKTLELLKQLTDAVHSQALATEAAIESIEAIASTSE